MESCCAPSVWIRRVLIVGFLGILMECHACQVDAQVPGKPGAIGFKACIVRDVRSRHFLLHTDLPPDKTDAYVARIEAELGKLAQYWGRKPRSVIECYVIRDLDRFPLAAIAPAGVRGVRTFGGVTLMEVSREPRPGAKSVVYATARLDVVQHEVVHAYCFQTFRRTGPVWYSEGMAEVGRFWRDEDTSVRADAREIKFLHNNPPRSLAEPVSAAQVTGDCWQHYASRWALCHFLATNPNYARQFRRLGQGLLAGKDVSFEQVYFAKSRQLFFEYLFFLEHISRGYRVDLCAWNWTRKFARANLAEFGGPPLLQAADGNPPGSPLSKVSATNIALRARGRSPTNPTTLMPTAILGAVAGWWAC